MWVCRWMNTKKKTNMSNPRPCDFDNEKDFLHACAILTHVVHGCGLHMAVDYNCCVGRWWAFAGCAGWWANSTWWPGLVFLFNPRDLLLQSGLVGLNARKSLLLTWSRSRRLFCEFGTCLEVFLSYDFSLQDEEPEAGPWHQLLMLPCTILWFL